MILTASIQIFSDPNIKRATSRNEIDPFIFRQSPTVLYVTIPKHKSAALAPLTAPFFIQMMEHHIETPMKVPVYFLLDEFANIGVIPNIERALATFRSREISISVGLQSINQLVLMYGKVKSHAILDNIKTKLVLPGLSHSRADYFSKLFGNKEVDIYSTSVQASHVNMGLNISKAKRELLSPEEIRTMSSEKMISVIDNLYPFADVQIRYYNDTELLRKTRNNLDIHEHMKNRKKHLIEDKFSEGIPFYKSLEIQCIFHDRPLCIHLVVKHEKHLYKSMHNASYFVPADL